VLSPLPIFLLSVVFGLVLTPFVFSTAIAFLVPALSLSCLSNLSLFSGSHSFVSTVLFLGVLRLVFGGV